MFLEYNWLVKYNLEVNWSTGIIWFTRCLRTCKTRHQDILFTSKYWRIQAKDKQDKEQQKIGKELDPTNLEDLPDYIQLFMHLFNKKKFEKLPERQEQDHEINLTEEVPRELNAKAYAMTIEEEEVLNQWLDKQLKAELIKESKLEYMASCFYIPKKDKSL